jgi:hypothetical protein
MVSSSNASDTLTVGTASGGFSITNSNNAYGLQFGSLSTGNSWIQSARLDGTATAYNLLLQSGGGRVGIGITSPACLLDVQTSSGSGRQEVGRFLAGPSATNNGSSITLGTTQTIGGYLTGLQTATDSGALVFGVQSSGSYFEAGRFDSSGRLGVGITPSAWGTSSTTVLSVGSGASVWGYQNDFRVCANFFWDGNTYKRINSGYGAFFICDAGSGQIRTLTTTTGSAGSTIGSWTDGPYVANLGTSWTNSSDERLKNITGEIQNGLAKVMTLRAAEFTWKADETATPQVGLIAQDVQAVLPEVISTSTRHESEDTTEYLGVAYDQVIPLLVAAIKELKAEIDTLKGAA